MMKKLLGMLSLGLMLGVSGAESEVAGSAFGQAGVAFRTRLEEASRTFSRPTASIPPDEEPAAGTTVSPKKGATVISAKAPAGVLAGVMVIGDEDSRGSGFLCELWGVPVLITNAHVYAQMEGSRIEDSRQNRYRLRSALVSRSRDIAILEIDLPESVNPLKLDYDVGKRKIDSLLWAFGDSRGARVVVELPGKLLGIGPDDIEISAGIVPGNSGGPVVAADGKVIGMSSYLLVNRNRGWDNPFAGTRFGNSGEGSNVRRFALRLDNLRMDDFEIFDPELQKKDLELYRRLSATNREFLRNVRELDVNKIYRLHYREYSADGLDWKYEPSIRFLAPMLDQQKKTSGLFAAVLGVPLPRATPAEEATAKDLFARLKPARQNSFSCRTCSGSGKIADPAFRGSGSASGAVREERICPGCGGIGQADYPYYLIVRDPLAGRVKASNLPFKGLMLGLSPDIALKIANPGSKLKRSTVNGVIELWAFPGNPSWPRATGSVVTLVGGRVGSTKVVFDAGRDTWESLKKELAAALGEPVIETGEEGLWSYIMYAKDGAEIALSTCERRNGKTEIHLTARHQVLEELLFRVLDELDNQVFSMPLPTPGVKPVVQNKRNPAMGSYPMMESGPGVRINTNPELFP